MSARSASARPARAIARGALRAIAGRIICRGPRALGGLGTAACGVLLAGAAAGLGGCAVGPDFKAPPAPPVERYTEKPLPAQTSASSAPDGEAQRFVEGMAIPAQWWTVFHSRALDALVTEALRSSPTVQTARAALREANELVYAQQGADYPQVAANYSVSRQRNAVGTLAPTLSSGAELFTLHTAQVSVSYLLDVFGLERRELESQRALADAQRYQLEATYLTLSSNVVAAAVQEASLRAQIAATRAIAGSERQALEIMRRQYELGSVAWTDVLAEQSELASTQAALPGLQKQLAQQRDLLAVLAGRFPGEGVPERFELADLTLPRDLPVSVPAALVRQRPDVLVAEAQLHAASAEVGVAIADMLPQVQLTGAVGGASATGIEDLFSAGNAFWIAGASLSQTLFSGGTLLHRKRAADAALDEAGAEYRSVVLSACQQVADALRALELDADAVSASGRAERAASDTLAATRRNVELGASSGLALLAAEQSDEQAAINLIQARANRYADTAALFQALGGGWWNARR